MSRTIPIFIAALIAHGCAKTEPASPRIDGTYQFVVGNEKRNLPLYADDKLIQDDLVLAVKALWENLQSRGRSETFYYTRTVSIDLPADLNRKIHEKGVDEFGPDARVQHSSTRITSSGKCQFFRDGDGTAGLQLLQEGKVPSSMIEGKDLNWSMIEGYLRKAVFDTTHLSALRATN
jgi:hypothetical protein